MHLYDGSANSFYHPSFYITDHQEIRKRREAWLISSVVYPCDMKLSEDTLDILRHNLSHNVLSKEVKLKHLYKLPQSGE